jgi:hypothetical protein
MPKPRRLGEILADLFTPTTSDPEPDSADAVLICRGRFPWSTAVYRDGRFDLRHECRDCQGSGSDPTSIDHDEPDLPCASCAGTGVITLGPDRSTSAAARAAADAYVSTIADDGEFGGEAA